MDYATVRLVHITCAITSVSLFALRGTLQGVGVDWRRWRTLRIAPHVNDTLLLAAAVTLAVRSAQYPLMQPWLTAKVLALLLYIAAGRLALQRDGPVATRRAAFGVALASVAYILLVALRRSPWPLPLT